MTSKGCVLDLRMRDKQGTSAHDYSRYGNDGTLTGCKWVEKGLEFNGTSDYVDCGNDHILEFGTGDFTLSAMVYLASWTPTNYPVIIGKGDTGVGEWMFRFLSSAKLEVYSAGAIANTGDLTFLSTWRSCAFVRNGDDGYIYVDGVQRGYSGGIAALDFDTNKDVLIGNGNLVSNRYINGSISDVRIYNRALNASEIKHEYEATKHLYI